MRRLRHSLKRLEQIEGTDRARRAFEEEQVRINVMMSDLEVNRAARRVSRARSNHGEDSPEFRKAVEEAEPIFELGMERYKQKQAEKEARR